jgi:predicted nucleic acid-binding protein
MPHFVDTNVVVYGFGAGSKSELALTILQDATISVQVLNEFANVCIRKLGHDRATLNRLISEIRSQVSAIAPVTEETHDLARRIVFRYQLGFYDSALLASALLADCDTFFSEDLHDGLVIEDQLTVRNPFV